MPSDESLSYQLRPATESDAIFMRSLYGSTREEELAVTGWERAQKDEFLDRQFDAQTRHYREHLPNAVWQIIVVDGADAGRLVTDRWASEHRIVDIALLPEFRGRGVGTHLLRKLQVMAAAEGCRLSIHVELNNPARTLYQRLGFSDVGEAGAVYQLMEWRPAD